MIAAFTNHLWQSTLFVLAAGVVAFALRKNAAHIRHRVWVIASLKFLVPFSVLMSLGSGLSSLTPPSTAGAAPDALEAPALSVAVDRLAQPFTDDVFFASTPATSQPSTNWTAVIIASTWACGFLAVAFMRFRGWRRIRAAMRTSAPVPLASPVPVRSSPGLLEPGVVGLWRPVLLVPAGIEQQLTRPQLDAVLAHELCHVQRRDNLTSAIHMVVEAAFWFHPLVWFVGARLVDERERACDEHVLRVCGEPQTYAESILNVCKLYVESPLACVSGVSGADLKKRITAIVNNRIGLQLNLARRAGLVLAATLAVVLPLVAGMLTAPLRASAIALAQSAAATVGQTPSATFDVVSVKPCPGNTPSPAGIPVRTSGGGRSGVSPYAAQTSPGHVYWDCVTLAQLVDQAYADRDHPLLNVVTQLRFQDAFQPKHVRGGPPWVRTDKFTIEAKSPVDITNPGLSGSPNRSLVLLPATMSQALRAMLEDRFQLRVHRATEQVDLFTLTIAKSGLNKQKMTAPVPGDCRTPEEYFASGAQTPMYVNSRLCGRIFSRRDGGAEFTSNTLQQLATYLSPMLDRFVVDKTDVAGTFNFELVPEPASEDTFGRTARALAALGLKLEPTKGPAEYLVIDSVQKPRPDFTPLGASASAEASADRSSFKPARAQGAGNR